MEGSISVVIPVINEAENLTRLLPYLKTHGGSFIREILVADGGSTDASAEVALKFGARVILHQAACRAAQMNAAANCASGSILYFVHADTIPPPSFGADIFQALADGHPMGCYRYSFDSKKPWLRINAYFNRFPWLWCQGGDKTFFIKKSLFDSLGGYDEYYTVMEEYDFLRRAAKKGLRIFTVPKNAIVSARKYERNSWIRVQFANFLVFTLFRFHYPPNRLKKIYRYLIN